MNLVSDSYPDWHVVFVSEADSIASSSFEIHHSVHSVHRYWPGEGSHALMFVVRDSLSSLSKSLISRNRLFSLELNSDSDSRQSLCIIGGHGPHDDCHVWHDFMGDLSWMIGERKRAGPVMCVGDWNVDYSPTFEHCPYSTGQHDEMGDRREIVDSFCAENVLDLVFADVVEDLPKNPLWAEKCMSFPFTRVPDGSQRGRPVLIDFCFASRSLMISSSGTWKNVLTMRFSASQ